MKKPKINFGEGGIKGWFIRHCEKFALGLVVVLALAVIYFGYSLPGLESNNTVTERTPDKLRQKGQAITTTVLNRPDTWKDVEKDRVVSEHVAEQVSIDLQQKINPDFYALANAWNKPDFRKLSPRMDPVISAPTSLKVVAYLGPIAMTSQDDSDVDLLPASSEEEESQTKARPKAKSTSKSSSTGPAGMPSMPGIPGTTPNGGKARPQRPKKGKDKGGDEDLLSGGMPGMPGGMLGMGGSKGGGMLGMPGFGGMSSRSGMGGPAEDATGHIYYTPSGAAPVARAGSGIVVMAAVPFKKLVDEYKRAFADSLDYNAERDYPRFESFQIQRVDVTDPAAPADKWVTIRNNTNQFIAEFMATMDGAPAEVLDPNYLDPVVSQRNVGVLTHPVPPFLGRDLWPALTHPDIPLASTTQDLLTPQPTRRRRYPKTKGSDEEEESVEDDSEEMEEETAGGSGPPGMPGMSSMPGMSGPPGMPGMSSMPGMSGPPGMPGMSSMPGMSGPPGMPGMSGMGGMSGGGGSYGRQVIVPKYKLIRFTDTSAEIGHKYRYRVRIALDDPNNPAAKSMKPSVASLGPAVRERLKKQAATEPKKRSIVSDWSQPSEIATLPAAEWFFAGKVTAPAPAMIDKYNVPTREISAKTLAVKLDTAKAVDVPLEVEVYRGSILNVLNLKESVEVTHPVLAEKRKLEKYHFQTNATVVDILGGESIPHLAKSREDELTAPGELLIFDSTGKLHVRNEALDVDDYRHYITPEEKEDKTKATDGDSPPGTATMPGGMLGPPGGMLGPGGPGGALPGGTKGRKKQ